VLYTPRTDSVREQSNAKRVPLSPVTSGIFQLRFLVSKHLSLWLYGPLDLGRFFSFLIYTQSVGLLGRGISPSQGRYLHTDQHKHRINAKRNPCLEWDSNPRPQCSSGRRRFMPQTARELHVDSYCSHSTTTRRTAVWQAAVLMLSRILLFITYFAFKIAVFWNHFLGCDSVVNFYQTTRDHIPEETNLHNHHCQGLKSHNQFYLLRWA
jgi:hypothetical protein